MTFGFVSNGEDEPTQPQKEELPCTFKADAAVGPCHYGCFALQANVPWGMIGGESKSCRRRNWSL